MKLHHDHEPFLELIEQTASYFKISERFIEKDYWVTYILKNLSYSAFKDTLIFKGGTSLSKAFKLISRFSEDIDLAFYPEINMTKNQVKQNLKKAEICLTHGLTYIDRHPEESKGSQFRKTYHQYPIQTHGESGAISQHILLEINHFSCPEPKTNILVQTLIADFLQAKHFHYLMDKFELGAFPINVLNVERTIAEKIVCLIRVSYSENPIQNIRSKVRHIYDLCMIMRSKQYRSFFENDKLVNMIKIAIEADKQQAFPFVPSSLAHSPLFSQPHKIWPKIKTEYNQLRNITYDSVPSEHDVFLMLEKIQSQLIKIK